MQIFRAVEFALSVRSIAQDAVETGSKIASSAARTAAHAVEAVVKAISSLPFPLNIAAGAATIAALAGIGVSVIGGLGGGSKKDLAPTNTGTGTVLGNSEAKSASIKNAIDALKEVDTLTNTYARQMAASLKTIESQIGNVASLVVRSGVNDGVKGLVATKASVNFVQEQIALAVLDPADPVSGQAATQVRINAVKRGSAEADAALGERIDSVDAIVNDALTGLPATRAQLSEGLKTAADRNTALVEQFEELRAELDHPNTGLAAAMATIIANKAAQVADNKAQTERIDAQGVVLDEQVAAIGRIDRALIDSAGGIAGTQMTIRQVTAAADTDAEALLRSMAAGEIAGQTRAAQLVQIQTEFTTSLVAGQLSEATARQALLARVGLAEAAIVTTSKAVADAQKAFTSRQDALEAAFNDVATGLAATRARIVALAQLTADQNKATTERLDLMDAQLLDPTTGKPISGATIAADRKAAADADSARVTDIAQLRGDVFDGPSGLPAVSGRIDRERELSLERDNALGIDVDRLAVEIHDPDDGLAAAHASIAAERQASVTRDNANAQAVQQVTARLDGIGGVGVEQSIETVVDRLGVIEGRYTVTIDANGNLTGFQLIGSDAGPGTLNLINTDLRMGTGRIVLNTGSFMQVQGLGFGKDSDLIEWFPASADRRRIREFVLSSILAGAGTHTCCRDGRRGTRPTSSPASSGTSSRRSAPCRSVRSPRRCC